MAQKHHHPSKAALDRRYVVARTADIPPGSRKIVEVAGRSIGIFNVDGEYYAFLNRCPHRGAELCKGAILAKLESDRPGDLRLDSSQKYLACPWHGWEFDLVTGQSWVSPDNMRARPFTIDVQSGEVVAAEIDDGVAVGAGDDVTEFIDPGTERIKGPYQADKVPLHIEDDYVVLSLRRQKPTADAGVATGERTVS